MKHIIEEIDEMESLIFEEKQRTIKIAASSVLWSFFAIQFGCSCLHDLNILSGVLAILSGSVGAKAYLGVLDSKDITKEYEKQLKELRK